VARVVHRFVEGMYDDPVAVALLLDGDDAIIHNSFDWDVVRSGDLSPLILLRNFSSPPHFAAFLVHGLEHTSCQFDA